MTYLHRLAKRIAGLRRVLLVSLLAGLACSKGEKVGFLSPDPNPAQAAPFTLRVEPLIASVRSGEEQRFTATGYSAQGAVVPVTVDWTAAGGDITPDGRFTGGPTGQFSIVARIRNQPVIADSARVSVWEDDHGIVELMVFPDSAVVEAGDSLQVMAALRLSNGDLTQEAAVTWSAAGGSIDANGMFSAPIAGAYVITAASPVGLSGRVTVLVLPSFKQLDSIALNPPAATIARGGSASFTATAHYSNGTSEPAQVAWSATGGSISSSGQYVAGGISGNYEVIARDLNGSLADTAVVAVMTPGVVRLAMTPKTLLAEPGANRQFTALAELSDQSWQSVPLTWSASAGSISTNGLFTAPLQAGNYSVIVTSPGLPVADTAQVIVSVPVATLTALRINPSGVTLGVGQARQFSAVADWSDGTSTTPAASWSATGGSISPSGLYTAGTAPGSFRVIGSVAGGLADTSSVVVTTPVLTSLSLMPGSATILTGGTVQFTVAGIWSDGGIAAPVVSWSASGGTMTGSGLFTAAGLPGTFAIIATHQGGSLADTSFVTVGAPIATLTGLLLTPSSVVLVPGATIDFNVFGTWSDGGTSTPQVTYTFTGGTMEGRRYRAGPVPGTYRVIARHTGGFLADTSSVVIPNAVTLSSLSIDPESASMAQGGSQQFRVTATWSNGSTNVPLVNWSGTGGTITPGGMYTAGTTAGSYQVIVAHQGGTRRDTANVTVLGAPPPPPPPPPLPPPTATLTSLSVAPDPVSLALSATRQFTLSATWSDGSTTVPPVTWASTGGTVSTAGMYTAGVLPGSFRVIATRQGGGKADTAAVTITAAPTATLTTLTVAPDPVSLAISATRQFTLSATWSDGSTTVPAVTWASTGGTVSSAGMYTAGVLPGSFRVIATRQGGGKADTAAVTITAAPTATLTTLTIAPDPVSLAISATRQFTLSATWSDGSTTVPAVTWASTGGTVSSAGMYTAGILPGSHRVIATRQGGGKADTAAVTITAPLPPPPPPPPPPPGSWQEPSGYSAIVGRHFNSLGTTNPATGYGNGRGTGPLPWMVGGSEGWDDIERTRTRITLAQDASAPLSPPSIMRMLYPPRVVPPTDTDSPGVAQMMGIDQPQGYYGTARNYRKLYFRTAFRVSGNFKGNPSSTNKMFFIRSVPGFEPIIRLRGAGMGPLVLNVDLQGSEGTGGDPRAVTGGLNPNTSSASLATIQRNRWYVLEGVLETGTDDAHNGVLRLWLDGVLTHSYSDVEYRKTGLGAGPDTWGYIHVAPTWGGGGGTIDALMWLDFDDFYVSGAP